MKKLLIFLLIILTLTGCSKKIEIVIPEVITPNTIEVDIKHKTLPLKDCFIESYIVSQAMKQCEDEEIKVEVEDNKQENKEDKLPDETTKPEDNKTPAQEENPKQETSQETEPPKEDNSYNVLNSKETYTITKSFKKPYIDEVYKQYALDIIAIIEGNISEKVTYKIDIESGDANTISEAINKYIDMYYDPTNSVNYIATNGVYRHKILEDGTLHMEFDIRPQTVYENIEIATTSKNFVIQSANSINITGNKVHDLREVHDYLCKVAEYDYTFNSELNSIYSLATCGQTRCAGYTEAFMAICNYLGMRVKRVEGIAGGGNHVWNSVEIEGKDYFIDVTWTDTGSNTYFLWTKEEISKTHTFS